MVRLEGGEGMPGECNGKVGGAKGQVRGCRLAVGIVGESGG